MQATPAFERHLLREEVLSESKLERAKAEIEKSGEEGAEATRM